MAPTVLAYSIRCSLLLKDPIVNQIGELGQQQQVVAPEAASVSPFAAVPIAAVEPGVTKTTWTLSL